MLRSLPRSAVVLEMVLVTAVLVDCSGNTQSPTGEGDSAVAVPRDAIIYEGSAARVWVVRDDNKAIELRRIKVGLTSGNMVEVMEGLARGDRVITKGSLFIDRVAAGT